MSMLTDLLGRLGKLFGRDAVEAAMKVGEWADTVDDSAIDRATSLPITAPRGEFVSGWWTLADRKDAHPGRIGKGIIPRTVIVHTTDMVPGTFNALVRNWTSQKGAGNAAHFLISKDGKVVQFASIYANANHAGGPNCGGFRGTNGATYHPNSVGIGIEIDNGGRLKLTDKGWVHPDKKDYVYHPEDVFVDKKGRGWERVTEEQINALHYLWLGLRPLLSPFPAGTVIVPNASYASQGAQYAETASLQIVGHASLNPVNKTDPGPQVMAEIAGWK